MLCDSKIREQWTGKDMEESGRHIGVQYPYRSEDTTENHEETLIINGFWANIWNKELPTTK